MAIFCFQQNFHMRNKIVSHESSSPWFCEILQSFSGEGQKIVLHWKRKVAVLRLAIFFNLEAYITETKTLYCLRFLQAIEYHVF